MSFNKGNINQSSTYALTCSSDTSWLYARFKINASQFCPSNPNNHASTRFITQKLAWVSLSEFTLNGKGSWREGQRVKNFIKNINKVKITLGSICLFYDQMNTLIIFTRHGSLIVEIVLSQFIEVFNYFQGVCFVWRFCFVFVCENQTTHDRNNSNSGLSLMEMLDFF